ncbi:hypothetical protein Tco_1381285, partial [Tanacetum coccineum]
GAPQGEELGLMKPLSVPNRFETLLVEWVVYPASPQERLQEILEQLAHLQVISPLTCLRLWLRKGLKRQKEAKNKDQKPTRNKKETRTRVKNQPKKSSRISPTQKEGKSKTPIEVKDH